jgi:transketolase
MIRAAGEKSEIQGGDMTTMTIDSTTLSAMADKLRRWSIQATTAAGSGHPTTCMSAAEVMSVLFFHEMRFDPARPQARDVDTFVMSKGHAAPILWAALYEAGAIKESPLTLRQFASPLEGHPTPLCPWVKIATGSLGQGLSAAAGIALARRMDGLPSRVYCLLGDGECAEGSVWEAAAFAAYNSLDTLCAIVDVNALGQSGTTMFEHDLEVYKHRFESFGWNALPVDGHSVDTLVHAFATARSTAKKPTVILAKTLKGKGLKAVEGKHGWHGKPLKKDEAEAALKEIPEREVKVEVRARRYDSKPVAEPKATAIAVNYQAGQEVATREAYGEALVKLGAIDPRIVALDGDTKNSTFSEKFKNAYPDRFVEAYIAEQNMAGLAAGLSADGKIAFASTFAAFLTRAYDFIRMANYSRPGTLVFVGSHCGVSIGEDGASQMGLEDLAMFRALIGTTVLYPSDAVAAEKLVAQAAKTKGVVYIRTSRPKTAIIYPNAEEFPIGGSKIHGTGTKAVIVAAGVTFHEALAAQKTLAKDGIDVRVLDLYSVKPIDAEAVAKHASETRLVVTVEDHAYAGGIGEAVAPHLWGAKLVRLAVDEFPRSGKPKELMAAYGIDAAAIVRAVKGAL